MQRRQVVERTWTTPADRDAMERATDAVVVAWRSLPFGLQVIVACAAVAAFVWSTGQ